MPFLLLDYPVIVNRKYGLASQQPSLLYDVFVAVCGHLCTFAANENIVTSNFIGVQRSDRLPKQRIFLPLSTFQHRFCFELKCLEVF